MPKPVPFITTPVDPQRRELLATLLLEELSDIYDTFIRNNAPLHVARGKSQEIFACRIESLVDSTRERFAHQAEEAHGQ